MERTNLGIKPYIFPQPVLILATYNPDGSVNAMNAAWGGMADDQEIMVCLSSHQTTDNLARNKACTIAIGDVDNVVACDYVGITSGKQFPDKFTKTGWTTTKSQFVHAPVINELPVSLDCTLEKIVDGCKYFFKIHNVSVANRLLTNGQIDAQKWQPLTYDPADHGYYARGAKVGQAFSDGKRLQ